MTMTQKRLEDGKVQITGGTCRQPKNDRSLRDRANRSREVLRRGVQYRPGVAAYN